MGVVRLPEGSRADYETPRLLAPDDRVENFRCGKDELDTWLKHHAFDNQGRVSRTYVVIAKSGADAGAAIAYYSLATGAATLKDIPRKLRHNMPQNIPVMVLGRLAVDKRHSGKGIGPDLLWEALRKTVEVSEIAGVRGLVVHAIDDDVITFYTQYGFQNFPIGTRSLWMPIETVIAWVKD